MKILEQVGTGVIGTTAWWGGGRGAEREMEGKSRPRTVALTVAQQDIKPAERNYAVALRTIL